MCRFFIQPGASSLGLGSSHNVIAWRTAVCPPTSLHCNTIQSATALVAPALNPSVSSVQRRRDVCGGTAAPTPGGPGRVCPPRVYGWTGWPSTVNYYINKPTKHHLNPRIVSKMETGPLGTLSFRIVRGDLRSPPAMESGVGNAGGEGDGQAGVRVRGGGESGRGVRGVESHFA